MTRHVFYIVGLLLLIELSRRLALTGDCWITLRYSPFLIDHGGLWSECVGRHLLFPFGY